MQREFEYPPYRLTCRDIMGIQIFLDLIDRCLSMDIHLDGYASTIMAFVDIFVEIFDNLDTGSDLDIDMIGILR